MDEKAHHVLMAESLIVGQSRVLSKEAKQSIADELDKERAAHARWVLQQKKEREKLVLIEAIKAVRGDGPVAKPSSEAARILPRVNKQLNKSGHKSVSKDTVYRCLKG